MRVVPDAEAVVVFVRVVAVHQAQAVLSEVVFVSAAVLVEVQFHRKSLEIEGISFIEIVGIVKTITMLFYIWRHY